MWSVLSSGRIAVIGHSLRDPTIGSIFEDVIRNLIEQRKIMPLSDDLAERTVQARENTLKIAVFTRDKEKLLIHLNN